MGKLASDPCGLFFLQSAETSLPSTINYELLVVRGHETASSANESIIRHFGGHTCDDNISETPLNYVKPVLIFMNHRDNSTDKTTSVLAIFTTYSA